MVRIRDFLETRGWQLSGLVCAGILLGLMYTSPVQGQTYGRSAQPDRHERTAPGRGADELPSWAEPSVSSRSTYERGRSSAKEAKGAPPPPPPPPSNVPVNGGLVWLMLAGAGYGVFRLSKE